MSGDGGVTRWTLAKAHGVVTAALYLVWGAWTGAGGEKGGGAVQGVPRRPLQCSLPPGVSGRGGGKEALGTREGCS